MCHSFVFAVYHDMTVNVYTFNRIPSLILLPVSANSNVLTYGWVKNNLRSER